MHRAGGHRHEHVSFQNLISSTDPSFRVFLKAAFRPEAVFGFRLAAFPCKLYLDYAHTKQEVYYFQDQAVRRRAAVTPSQLQAESHPIHSHIVIQNKITEQSLARAQTPLGRCWDYRLSVKGTEVVTWPEKIALNKFGLIG